MFDTNTKKLAGSVAVAVLACGTVAAVAASSQASDELAPAAITASVTDSTPASGETFRVSGKLTRDGRAIAGRTVKVQTLRAGVWQDLSGASMTTSSTGGYNLRLVLGSTGVRDLRVVGLVARPRPAQAVHGHCALRARREM